MRYKVPVTLTINFDAFIDAGSPDGALTDIKTMLDFNGDALEDTEGLLFGEDEDVTVENATAIGQPSFGAVEEAPEESDEDESSGTDSDEATPPKPDLK